MKLCHFEAGLDRPLFLIAGTCVVESRQMALDTAGRLKEITDSLTIPFIYKSSYDKANRSSGESFRGPGMEEGLRILDEVRSQIGVPVLTDVHEDTPLDEVCDVVDVLQTPAFLCRQTNFIQSVARTGKPVNIKKGQFLAPWDMKNVVDKARATGNDQIMVCERGVSFGYNNLVSDMRALAVMRDTLRRRNAASTSNNTVAIARYGSARNAAKKSVASCVNARGEIIRSMSPGNEPSASNRKGVVLRNQRSRLSR